MYIHTLCTLYNLMSTIWLRFNFYPGHRFLWWGCFVFFFRTTTSRELACNGSPRARYLHRYLCTWSKNYKMHAPRKSTIAFWVRPRHEALSAFEILILGEHDGGMSVTFCHIAGKGRRGDTWQSVHGRFSCCTSSTVPARGTYGHVCDMSTVRRQKGNLTFDSDRFGSILNNLRLPQTASCKRYACTWSAHRYVVPDICWPRSKYRQTRG